MRNRLALALVIVVLLSGRAVAGIFDLGVLDSAQNTRTSMPLICMSTAGIFSDVDSAHWYIIRSDAFDTLTGTTGYPPLTTAVNSVTFRRVATKTSGKLDGGWIKTSKWAAAGNSRMFFQLNSNADSMLITDGTPTTDTMYTGRYTGDVRMWAGGEFYDNLFSFTATRKSTLANGDEGLADVNCVGPSGGLCAGVGASTFTLASTASAVAEIYDGQLIYITGGTGAGQVRLITSYAVTTKVATITPAWTTQPASGTSTYVIVPVGPADVEAWLRVAALTPGASNGLLISGSNAGTTTFGALTVTGTTTHTGTTVHTGNVSYADGITITDPTTAAIPGLSIVGSTTSPGVSITGGPTNGVGLTVTGGATNANAVTLTGTGTGHGLASTSGSGATGDGANFAAASTNGNGLKLVGTGTGAALTATGAANGITASGTTAGLNLAGVTNGNGMTVLGLGTGVGASITGGGTNAAGMTITGGATNSNGLTIAGTGTGHGLAASSGTGATGDGAKFTALSTNGNGLNTVGTGTGSGHAATGAAAGILASGTTAGLSLSGVTNGLGLSVTGAGTGNGATITGGNGATGNALAITAASTNGTGAVITGTGTGDAINLVAAGSGDGLDANAGDAGGGLDISGTLTTVTGVTNQVSANVTDWNSLGATLSISGGYPDVNTIAMTLNSITASALGANAVYEIVQKTMRQRFARIDADCATGTTGVTSSSLTESQTDYWVNSIITFVTGVDSAKSARVIAFTPSTDSLTFAPALAVAPAASDSFTLWGVADWLPPTTTGRTLDVSSTGEAGIDWANIGSPTTTVALTGTTVGTVTTTTNLTKGALQSSPDSVRTVQANSDWASTGGDSVLQSLDYTNDVYHVYRQKLDTVGIGVQVWGNGTKILTAGTNISLAKGVGLTGLNDIAAADVWTATGGDSVLQSLDYTNDVYHVYRQKLDTVGQGVQVWGNGTKILTAGTNIALAKGVGLTGLNDIAAQDVWTATGGDSVLKAINDVNKANFKATGFATPTNITAGVITRADSIGHGGTHAIALHAADSGQTYNLKASQSGVTIGAVTTVTRTDSVGHGGTHAIALHVADSGQTYNLKTTQTFNNTGTWTGNLTGSVGSLGTTAKTDVTTAVWAADTNNAGWNGLLNTFGYWNAKQQIGGAGGGAGNDSLQIRRWVWDSTSSKYVGGLGANGIYHRVVDSALWNLTSSACGSGAHSTTIICLDTSGVDAVVGYCFVTIYNNAQTSIPAFGSANSIGVAGPYGLTASTAYKGLVTAPGFTFPLASFTTTSGASETDTIKGYDVIISGSSSPSTQQVALYDWAISPAGDTLYGAEVKITLVGSSDFYSSSHLVPTATITTYAGLNDGTSNGGKWQKTIFGTDSLFAPGGIKATYNVEITHPILLGQKIIYDGLVIPASASATRLWAIVRQQ